MKRETVREPSAKPPHGGSLATARLEFPDAPTPLLDLSTGINPHAHALPPLTPDMFTRLPEPDDLAALEAVAASAYGATDAAMVVAAPGTQALIGLLPRLRAPARVAILAPTYAEHAHCWRACGHDVTTVPRPDPPPGADIFILCNPNNPDGRRDDPGRLLGVADDLARRGGWLIVDEAFADFEFSSGLSLVPTLPRANIIVLRSFGKTYGLAGVRLGFAVAAPALADDIRAALGPWPVSGPTIAIGRHALADTAWRHAERHRLAQDAARLDTMLRRAGMLIRGGTHLFRLGESDAAPEIYQRLGEAGIVARRFAENPRWLRFGIPGDAAAFARLAAVLDNSPGGRS